MISNSQLKEILQKTSVIADKKTLDSIVKKAEAQKESLEDYIIKEKIISEESIYEAVADYHHLPFVNLKKQIIRKDVLSLIPEVTAQENKIIPFDETGDKIKVAMLDPNNLEIIDFIEKKTGLTP